VAARRAKRSAVRGADPEGSAAPTSKRLVVRLSEDLKKQLLDRVQNDGYGERGVSQWIREALSVMLKQERALDLVGQGDRLDGQRKAVVVVTVAPGMAVDIRDTLVDLRERDLMMEGPQSVLVRSVIRFRLTHPALSYAKPSSSRSSRRRRVGESQEKIAS